MRDVNNYKFKKYVCLKCKLRLMIVFVLNGYDSSFALQDDVFDS